MEGAEVEVPAQKPRFLNLGKRYFVQPGEFIVDRKNGRLLENVSGRIIRLPFKKIVVRRLKDGE